MRKCRKFLFLNYWTLREKYTGQYTVNAYTNMCEPTGRNDRLFISEGAALPCQQQVSGWKICKLAQSAHTRRAVEACRHTVCVPAISPSSNCKGLKDLIKRYLKSTYIYYIKSVQQTSDGLQRSALSDTETNMNRWTCFRVSHNPESLS